MTYASGFSYTADGKIEKLKLGNNRWEWAKFNERLQVTELALGRGVTDASLWDLKYEYGELSANGTVDTAKNTGNIAKQTLSFSGLTNPLVQTFKYDSLYRLTEARETTNSNQTWKESYTYDRFGNRTGKEKFVGTTQITLDNKTHPQIDPNTNRFNGEQGYIYDKNGNLTTDAEGRSFVFNGDNKQREIKDSSNNVVGRYFYDGEGKRVKKITNTEETVFVYSSGKLVAEYTTAAPPPNPTTSYTVTDQLGSPRVITNSLGEVVSRRDFMPFGEEAISNIGERPTNLKYGTNDGIRQKFTGYQKDDETNLDFAEARMYENRHGRFTAVDPLLASGTSANPQTFNRYVYVGNNPILRSDPTGLIWLEDPNNKGTFQWVNDKFYKSNAGQKKYKGWTNANGVEFILNRTNNKEWEWMIGSIVRNETNGTISLVKFKDDIPTMQAPSSPNFDSTRPGLLLLEFLSGTGEQDRFFGPDSKIADEMRTSPDLIADRNKFCETACEDSGSSYERTGSQRQFGLTGSNRLDSLLPGLQGNSDDSHVRAFFEANESRLFVGSFKTTITESDKTTRLTTFTITNGTGIYSGSLHLLKDRRQFNSSPLGNFGGYPSNWRPALSNINQIIMWSEINPCGCKK